MKRPDETWMRRALELARRGEGRTRPNPPVGAVIVRAGRVVGDGWHSAAGKPHAEIEALKTLASPALSHGATLYVTLEPCCTHGRTPPCTDAILKSGIRRVVVGAVDPNPKHRGRGLRLLRRHGIEVTPGVCAEEARELMVPFASRIQRGRPWVVLKMACSLDGRIADALGASRWITGPASRRKVQELRRQSDAVLIGTGTALADDPSLLPRPSKGRRPWRVILDRGGRLPLSSKVLMESPGQTLVIVSPKTTERRRKEIERHGARCWEAGEHARGGFALGSLMKRLAREYGVMRVLCEGGGRLAASLIREGLADEIWWGLAPKVLGGDGVPAVGGAGWPLARAPEFEVRGVERRGGDVWIRAVRKVQGRKRR